MAAKKLGRPTDSPKVITVKIRFDVGTSELLKECSERMGISRAEIVRRGVKKMYEELPKE